jgi:hypothetical protein
MGPASRLGRGSPTLETVGSSAADAAQGAGDPAAEIAPPRPGLQHRRGSPLRLLPPTHDPLRDRAASCAASRAVEQPGRRRAPPSSTTRRGSAAPKAGRAHDGGRHQAPPRSPVVGAVLLRPPEGRPSRPGRVDHRRPRALVWLCRTPARVDPVLHVLLRRPTRQRRRRYRRGRQPLPALLRGAGRAIVQALGARAGDGQRLPLPAPEDEIADFTRSTRASSSISAASDWHACSFRS